MKFTQIKNQKGVTLVEMVVTLGIIGVLGLILVNVSRYADRQVKIQIEDVQTMINKLGASKIMTRDLANANLSFNYIHLADDLDPATPRPFFVFAKNEYCQESASNVCRREYKLEIPTGQTVSKPFYAIVIRGYNNELLKFPRSVEKDVFTSSAPIVYNGLNDPTDPVKNIEKSNMPDSPWMADRLMMLTSNNDYFDCYNKIATMTDTTSCPITCTIPGTCNFVAKRELKLLGIVKADLKDLNFHTVSMRPDLLKKNYRICNLKEDMTCSSTINFPSGVVTSKTLFEKMPFIPGQDNGATLSPVELVRYHLERPTASSPDHQIRLFRSMASLSGGTLSFERAHILMTGVQSIVFTRTNISNPTIEYKINKVRLQKSIK